MSKEEFTSLMDFAKKAGLMNVPLDIVIERWKLWKKKETSSQMTHCSNSA